MGIPGVPFKPDKEHIINILKETKGVISHAAKKLSVERLTLYRYINNNPDIKELLNELRNAFDENMLDMAENVLVYAMSQANLDVSNALKASFFALNNKGRERGYAHPKAVDSELVNEFAAFNERMKQSETKPEVKDDEKILGV